MFDSFATPWTIAFQAPLSMGFPNQEYCSELPFPSPHLHCSMCQCVIPFYVWKILHCMNGPHIVSPFSSWWTFGYFPPLAAVTGAAVNSGLQASVGVPVFSSFGYIHRTRIAGSCSNCFHVLAIVNNAAMNISIHISLQDIAFTSYGYIYIYTPISGIAVSYGNSIFNFVCRSGCTNFYFHWQCTRVPISSYPH